MTLPPDEGAAATQFGGSRPLGAVRRFIPQRVQPPPRRAGMLGSSGVICDTAGEPHPRHIQPYRTPLSDRPPGLRESPSTAPLGSDTAIKTPLGRLGICGGAVREGVGAWPADADVVPPPPLMVSLPPPPMMHRRRHHR